MAWILQGNPNRFDIDGYLPNSPFIYWRAPRQQGEFSVGDRAFLWRAGESAGVVAVGRIRELPTARRSVSRPDALGDALWASAPADPSEAVVGVDIEEVRLTPAEGMLGREALKNHPEFRDARIIRSP